MRTATVKTQTGLEASVTQPIILVSLGFSTTLYFSSRGDITWDGQTWIGGRLSSGSVSLRGRRAGGAEGTVTLANHDNAMTAIILSEGASGKEVKVWYLYGDGPYVADDAVLIFDGQMDGVSRMDDVAQIDILSDGLVQWTPRITCTPERFPHMQPAGTEIAWGGEKFILEPDPEAF